MAKTKQQFLAERAAARSGLPHPPPPKTPEQQVFACFDNTSIEGHDELEELLGLRSLEEESGDFKVLCTRDAISEAWRRCECAGLDPEYAEALLNYGRIPYKIGGVPFLDFLADEEGELGDWHVVGMIRKCPVGAASVRRGVHTPPIKEGETFRAGGRFLTWLRAWMDDKELEAAWEAERAKYGDVPDDLGEVCEDIHTLKARLRPLLEPPAGNGGEGSSSGRGKKRQR